MTAEFLHPHPLTCPFFCVKIYNRDTRYSTPHPMKNTRYCFGVFINSLLPKNTTPMANPPRGGFCYNQPLEVININNTRLDRTGSHKVAFEANKKRIYATQTVCGICGKPVDFSIKYPHPMSPCIDHIIPLAKGGHPSALENLQLAHRCCNRQKSDKLTEKIIFDSEVKLVSNRALPQSVDWKNV